MAQKNSKSFTDDIQIQNSLMRFRKDDQTQETFNENVNYDNQQFIQQQISPFFNEKEDLQKKWIYIGNKLNHNNYNEDNSFQKTNSNPFNAQIDNYKKKHTSDSFKTEGKNDPQISYDQYSNQIMKPRSFSIDKQRDSQYIQNEDSNQCFHEAKYKQFDLNQNLFDFQNENISQDRNLNDQISNQQAYQNQKCSLTEGIFTHQNTYDEINNHPIEQFQQINSNINKLYFQQDCNSSNKYDQINIQSLENQNNCQEQERNPIIIDDYLYDSQQFGRYDDFVNTYRDQSEKKSFLMEQNYCEKSDFQNCYSIEPQVNTDQKDSQKFTQFWSDQFDDNLGVLKDQSEKNSSDLVEQSGQLKQKKATIIQQNQQIVQKNLTCQTLVEESLTLSKQQQKQQKQCEEDEKKSKVFLGKTFKSNKDKQKQQRKSKHFQIITEIKQQNFLEIDFKLLEDFKNDIKKNLIRDMLNRCNKNVNQELLSLINVSLAGLQTWHDMI
ncbi:hypothetical protein TTHERM_00491090 (macronuclear) [Tetrahymena thermophila SB210]|uniref:Uncharacterized protein n=1 Tax=Tetrahymena thermophila (strain SB210) TaxID=312017 RepID=Q23J63_TETTS|nr:hypothetical protein TTHERM_00491090 [Tetrahymena thermophila SB210]EAR96641.2 hypothetical protein TTHERM_00491090 [Tetrahymena thermophila SB210]|eukprot:XP_001016886.2 hypothetical protein TTHERM_00491090 [Tetrahymena thermophila SB210]